MVYWLVIAGQIMCFNNSITSVVLATSWQALSRALDLLVSAAQDQAAPCVTGDA